MNMHQRNILHSYTPLRRCNKTRSKTAGCTLQLQVNWMTKKLYSFTSSFCITFSTSFYYFRVLVLFQNIVS